MKHVSGQTQITIDPDKARELGGLFLAGREAQKLKAQEVADKLLLSKQQVLGLEAGEQNYFYGVKLYIQAADKYADFLKLGKHPSELLLATSADDAVYESPASLSAETTKPAAVPIEATKPGRSGIRAMPTRLVISSLLAAGILIAVFLNQSSQITAETPVAQTKVAAEPAPASIPTPAPAEPEKPTAAATIAPPQPEQQTAASQPTTEKCNDIATGNIRLTFSGSSWVQIVDSTGKKQEHTYRDGDSLTSAPATLQALVIGNARAVSVTSANGEISLNPYISSGSQVARIIGPQVRQLVDKSKNQSSN